MPRERLCKACGGWHDLDQPWPHNCTTHEQSKRAEGIPVPMMNFDSMDAVRSMTNGLYYDSKSALRREYRRAGVVEVGNDVPMAKPKPDPAAQKKKIKETVGKALSRAGFGA